MKIQDCSELAHQLMAQHGLSGWSLKYDESKRRFGQCRMRDQVISLSWRLVDLNDEPTVQDTILHEIAHALCPKEHHNWKWQAKLLEIGGDGKRCYDLTDTIVPKAKYKTTCPECGHEGESNKIRNCSCGHCSRVYSPLRKLIYKLND